jgi:hypothetical protein
LRFLLTRFRIGDPDNMVEFEIPDDKVENAWCFLIIGLTLIFLDDRVVLH